MRLGIMAILGAGPVVAAGWLAATAAGAVADGAAGGPIGALTKSGVSDEHAHVYAEGLRRGGTLVTAKVDDSLQAEAEAILRKSNWVDPVQRRAAYAEGGWTRFDDTLDPYGPAEIEQERLRYRRLSDKHLFRAIFMRQRPARIGPAVASSTRRASFAAFAGELKVSG